MVLIAIFKYFYRNSLYLPYHVVLAIFFIVAYWDLPSFLYYSSILLVWKEFYHSHKTINLRFPTIKFLHPKGQILFYIKYSTVRLIIQILWACLGLVFLLYFKISIAPSFVFIFIYMLINYSLVGFYGYRIEHFQWYEKLLVSVLMINIAMTPGFLGQSVLLFLISILLYFKYAYRKSLK